jgi:enolase
LSKIAQLKAREILDSRGFPTVEVDVVLENGCMGRASVPSGKSTGRNEAYELRDEDEGRYRGKGVLKVVEHVQQDILHSIRGMSALDQAAIDDALIQLDGTDNKQCLGANAILGVSLATARAAAKYKNVHLVVHLAEFAGHHLDDLTLPIPMMNVINGGKHADSGISVQEFKLVPHGATKISQAIQMGAETYHALKDLLARQGHRISVGDEGGFAPKLATNEAALQILCEAILAAGYQPGQDISIGLDFAANDFYANGKYHLEGHDWSSDDMIEYCVQLINKFPIVSIEDGLAEDDWDAWPRLTNALKKVRVQCLGDDIFVTNPRIFAQGIQQGIADAILIKPNQIGTLTETVRTMKMAADAGYKTVMSHRSGETTDTFIADLAVATNARQMKSGAPARGERIEKYNQLIRLAEELPDLQLATGLYRFS